MGDPAPTPDPTPAPNPEQPPTDPAPTDPTAPPDDGKGGKDAILADLARERDKRQALEQQVNDLLPLKDQFAAIAKVFGAGEEEPPDPAKLAEQITSSQAETATEKARADAAEKKLAVFLAAGEHEANPVALLDSASFLDALKDVDHADAEKLGEVIKAAVERDARFKVTPATPPFPGGPRSSATPRAGSLGEAIANKLATTRTS